MTRLKNIVYTIYSRYLIKKYGYRGVENNDRDILERVIFPYVLAYRNPKKILDIGREDYQAFYNKFFIAKELWTLDRDPERIKYGAKNHITDDVDNLKSHFQDNYFDFILMNGVLGWGLDDRKEVSKAFNAIYDILKPGGLFILGWNDDIVPFDEIDGLKKLKPYSFPPLKTTLFKCINGNHHYNFYTK